jgi:hypothetical protein
MLSKPQSGKWNVRNINAKRAMACIYGVYAGLLGMEHGYFETLHGNAVTLTTRIAAVLPPGLPFPFGDEPALTIIPNFLVTGLLAMLTGLIIVIWSGGFVQKKYGGLVLLLLSIILLLVGGGYAPISLLIVASISGIWINTSLARGSSRFALGVTHFLATLWPWFFVMTLMWVPVEFILGYLFGLSMNLSVGLSFPIIVPLFLSLLAGFAYDIHQRERIVVG